MYGGSNRYGRVGGRGGGGKRSLLPMGPPHRPSKGSGSRHFIGGSSGARGRHPSTSLTGSGVQVAAEETFSLVPGNPLFASIIRLAPSLIDEIKRCESEGGEAKIMFDANPNHASGNVINVGGKEFRFSWSREMGHLCDIYEECQGHDNGSGLLVESGCPWRKLNVQRVLDESTKNHVKMRSVEADRKLRARKAIVLEPGNPSMKRQMEQLAAAEVNPWKNKQKKDPPFKKRKFEPPQAALTKSVYKSGVPSTNTIRGRRSSSPLLSTPEQSLRLTSPSITGNFGKAQTALKDNMHIPVMAEENIENLEKVGTSKSSGGGRDFLVEKVSNSSVSTDLRSMLYTILKEKPNGMSLKALEKAVGDAFPNSVGKIEPILKKIATFQSPGRYLLRPEADMESSNKLSASGSSPEDDHHKLSVRDDLGTVSAQVDSFLAEKSPAEGTDDQATLTAIFGDMADLDGNNDISQHPQDGSGDGKGSLRSSSESGSDSESDSDSSDSGTDSGSQSRSRSRSPGGSASKSSSDTESDSANSKQGSDVDVDIMTSDDEKEPMDRVKVSEAGLSASSPPWRMSDGRPMQNGIIEKQDDDDSEDVDIEGLPEHEHEAAPGTTMHSALNAETKHTEKLRLPSPNHDENLDLRTKSGTDRLENNVIDDVSHEEFRTSESARAKLRVSDVKQTDNSPQQVKRLKYESSVQSSKPVHASQRPHQSEPSPDRSSEDHYKDINCVSLNRQKDDNSVSGQRAYDDVPGRSALSGRQAASFLHDPEAVERTNEPDDSLPQGRKYQETTSRPNRTTSKKKDKVLRETPGGEFNVFGKSDKKLKDCGRTKKPSVRSGSRKHEEQVRKVNSAEHFTDLHVGSSPKDHDRVDAARSPVVKSGILQRELSDLELGELREPSFERSAEAKQFESSMKLSDNKVSASHSWNAALSKGKSASKAPADSGKPSPPNLVSRTLKGAHGTSRQPDLYFDDPSRGYRSVQSHLHSGLDQTDVRSLSNKAGDNRPTDSGGNRGADVEGCGETHKKSQINVQSQESKKACTPSKSKKSNSLRSSSNGIRGPSLNEGLDGDLKKSESSSDESSSYSQYAKDEPELKGPITSFLQYKEYVLEYNEKYDSYCSLNKILESYRTKFKKLGRELESAKDRDTDKYYSILGQLRQSYQQCGTRHKRLKKIFVVLHKELTQLKQTIKNFAETCTRE